ncbi:MAG TPA: DNA-binding transcriptional regulator Fis [Gammaproteobacteria bacterium]|nr:DNA-binding transcriptional regulator Fis [Gammaproteobacteria bacterium]MEC8011921.1 DNA-binding transcriptional regulator Fis [Pseudomonadota bacterium]HBF07637.1 DNA-binding transcriptional regulator Fis [Gammaproteobacteria bacterium]HCK93652.1 DNA-binding transcriptional regulator Fis [Gammaproteobacteria bacterium]
MSPTLNRSQQETQLEPLGHGTLRDHVDRALANYFAHLDGHPVDNVYELVLSEIEPPLLERVLKFTNRNQTKASAILGLNRGTLRKKLKMYGLLT